jgi:DNA-binding Xre family transcriptional regulator
MKVIIINKIDDRIKIFCENEKLKKTDVAAMLGFSKQNLEKICNSPNPTLMSLIKVSIAIGVRPSDLYEYKITK